MHQNELGLELERITYRLVANVVVDMILIKAKWKNELINFFPFMLEADLG